MPELSDRDVEILRLAGAFFRFPANREAAARERFGMGAVEFWAAANRLIDTPAAALVEPEVTARLRRLREQRAGQRTARRVG